MHHLCREQLLLKVVLFLSSRKAATHNESEIITSSVWLNSLQCRQSTDCHNILQHSKLPVSNRANDRLQHKLDANLNRGQGNSLLKL